MSEHGEYGQENRKFLVGIYKPQPSEVFMKVAPDIPLPAKCDLRTLVGPLEVYNQGSLGSCTANAIASAYKLMSFMKYRKKVAISRLFVYYNERVMINQVFQDSGAFIKDGFMSMQTQGACLESYWPYNETTIRPPQICYNSYNAQLDPRDMVKSIKQCLALNLPVVIGVLVYDSFQSAQAASTGFIPYPNVQTEKLLGGHAICCIGYDDSLNHFIFVNSWGTVWGNQGVGYIPYAFIANNDLCNDCHAFLNVELRLLGEDEPSGVSFDCLSPKNFDSCNLT